MFFALFGIFLTQYVPLWMTDNESQFTSQASSSFAQFKAGVDLQYVLAGPPSIGTTFTMSSNGVPLIAQPTQGTLVFLPTTCPNGFATKTAGSSVAGQPVSSSYCVFENITLSAGPGGSGLYSQHIASGVLEMGLPNRYYSAQTFYFEDDAVIESQGGLQQIMSLAPPLNVSTAGGNTSVTTSFLNLIGNASTVIGQGSQQVFSHLRYAQVVTSNGARVGPRSLLNLTFEIGTQYPCAWQGFLRSMMNSSGVPYAATPTAYPATSYNWGSPLTHAATIPVPASACFSASNTYIVALNVVDVSYATVFYAGTQLTLGVGGT